MRTNRTAIALAIACAGPACAQHVRVLGDIEPRSLAFIGFPEGPTLGERGASVSYFVFADPFNFVEVWRTDGTPEGTRTLGDVSSFRPNLLGVVGDTVVFECSSILASSDGTPGEFVEVMPRYFAPNRNSIDSWLPHAAREGRLYFGDQGQGNPQVRLYASDGTAAGTSTLFSTNTPGARVSGIAATPSKVFATVEASPNFPRTLLVSTGNPPAPATTVRTFPAGSIQGLYSFDTLVPVGESIAFIAPDNSLRRQIWVSDGTDAGTRQVSAFTSFSVSMYAPTWNGSRLAFIGPGTVGSGEPARWLWTSDLTPQGTARATFPYQIRLNPQVPAPSPFTPRTSIVALNGAFAFVADRQDNTPRFGLYVGDLSAAGTAYISTGAGAVNELLGASPDGSVAYLTVSVGATTTLWRTDGTQAGTFAVPVIPASLSSLDFRPLTWVGNSLVVGVRQTTNEWTIWCTDGTSKGTRQIAGIGVSPRAYASSSPTGFTPFDGTVVFGADNATSGYERYKTTGAPMSAIPCDESAPGDDTNLAPEFVTLDGRLFTHATSVVDVKGVPTNRDALFVTTSSTELGDLVYQSGAQAGIRYLSTFNHRLLFGAPMPEDINETTLWASDGTPKGTAPLVGPGPSRPRSIVASAFEWRGDAYFVALAPGASHYALWKTDGTEAGTVSLAEFPGTSFSAPTYFVPAGDTLFFNAYDSGTFNRLWCTDGTSKGTRMVSDQHSMSAAAGFGAPFALLNGRLYVSSLLSGDETDLWVVAPGAASLEPVVNIAFGAARCTYFTPLGTPGGDRLCFVTTDSAHGTELWMTDGYPDGTGLLADIFPGAFSSSPAQLTRVGNTIYFTAMSGPTGRELFRTDGTAAGTTLAADVAPGPDSSSPGAITEIGGLAYFAAYHPGIGREPLALPLGPCVADFTDDDSVNSQDFFAFLGAFFTLDPRADVNHDDQIDSRDFFAFLTAFFTGCP
jgi:ELWxxDGT repeat protein